MDGRSQHCDTKGTSWIILRWAIRPRVWGDVGAVLSGTALSYFPSQLRLLLLLLFGPGHTEFLKTQEIHQT